jgi:hypothetical protein
MQIDEGGSYSAVLLLHQRMFGNMVLNTWL